jgi:hypothetical protein
VPRTNCYEDEFVRITAEFDDIRRHRLCRLIPFTTECRPRIALQLFWKHEQVDVSSIAVECYSLQVNDQCSLVRNLGWSTDEVRQGGKYRINILLRDCKKGEWFSVGGKIMLTGRVCCLDNVWTVLARLSTVG